MTTLRGGEGVGAVERDVVGVDFGTATTFVAELAAGAPAAVLPLGRSTNWLPSTVRVNGSALLVGEDADEVSPELVIRSVKKAITNRSDTFTVPDPSGSEHAIEVHADRAIAAVLEEAVARARSAGVTLNGARQVRLGCPAMWDGEQRRRLLSIATAAGLAVPEQALIDEPVAAGVAWLMHRYLAAGERPAGRLLIFDMGGGTLDVAVLAVTGGPQPDIAVQACLGMPMAGDALDVAIARDIADEIAQHRVDVTRSVRPELAWALLERAAREAKVRLSHVEEHPIVLPPQLGYPHVVRYRREQLEAAFQSQMDGAENLVISALRAARLAIEPASAAELRAISRSDLAAGIDFVVRVGGMSRIPYIARRLATLFPAARQFDDAGVPPEETVVAGLTEPTGFDRIRLHRPTFDFVFDGEHGRVVAYPAYTPLYEPWQVYSGHSSVGYERRFRPPELPARGLGTLRAVSGSGEPLRMTLDGQLVDGLPVPFGPDGVVFGLTSHGRIDIVDAAGQAQAFLAEGWPGPGRHGNGPVLHRMT
jgi:molecular chaperone DnaK (HSP70)